MKVKSILLTPLFLSILIAVGLLSACKRNNSPTSHATPMQKTDTTALLVMRVRESARLYTAEMQIHKLVTHTDDPRVKGQLLGVPIDLPARVGHRSIAIPIDVTLKAYIDFSNFTDSNVQRTDSSLIITLPNPQVIVTSTRVDNKGIRQYIDALRSRYTDAEVSDFARQGADSITAHLSRFGLEERARQSAANQLLPIFVQLGYDEEHVTLRFAQPLTDKDWHVIKN